MRIVYFGTPDFAVAPLRALSEAGHELVLVVTQPDKPRGRGHAMQFPPVKEEAIRLGIPVAQPERARDADFIDLLRAKKADLFVVTAFGQLLPKEILELPRYGCVNIHASLLPAYRGAAPIQWAIIDGQRISGITTMQMDEGLDTGDILRRYPLGSRPRRPAAVSLRNWKYSARRPYLIPSRASSPAASSPKNRGRPLRPMRRCSEKRWEISIFRRMRHAFSA